MDLVWAAPLAGGKPCEYSQEEWQAGGGEREEGIEPGLGGCPDGRWYRNAPASRLMLSRGEGETGRQKR
jgi:hypothetical protein